MNKPAKADAFRKTNRRSAIPIYDALRRSIISMELKPGADLDEKSLVAMFGVSRTPVREALIRLAAEGLVDIRLNRGASVANLDLQVLQSIFEAGDLIEKAIMRLACLRRTPEDLRDVEHIMHEFEADMARKDIPAMVESNSRFHLRIAEASGNKYFLDCYRRILADHERIAQIWYAHNIVLTTGSANSTIAQQHREILEALENRDAEHGEALSKQHADLCKDGVRDILSAGERVLADISVITVDLETAQ